MGRYAADTGGGDFVQAPPGTYIARCIKLIDIGTHHGEYQGTPNVRNQIIAQFELPNETFEFDGEEKPLIVSKFYTNSLSEKANLRKDLEAWRSKPFTVDELMRFDLMNILGKACMLTVVHNEKGNAKIASVSPLMKGVTVPEAYNAPAAFWIDEWDQVQFDALSEGFKKLIRESDEYKKRGSQAGRPATSQGSQTEDFDDDIPF